MNSWRWESTPPLDPEAIGKLQGQRGWRAILRDTGRSVRPHVETSLSAPLWDWVAVMEWKPGDRVLMGCYQRAADAKRAVDSALTGLTLHAAARESCTCDYCQPKEDYDE